MEGIVASGGVRRMRKRFTGLNPYIGIEAITSNRQLVRFLGGLFF